MPLELSSISQQVEQMVRSLATEEQPDRLTEARALLRNVEVEEFRHKLRHRLKLFPWLVAIPVGTLDRATSSPEPSGGGFSVVAADGSSIPPDRHGPGRYYVINTGYAVLTYGSHPNAVLDSAGKLYFEDEELYIEFEGRRIPIEGTRLGVKRSVMEMRTLLDAARQVSKPAIALYDGSLILWVLQNEDRAVQEELLGEFLTCLDEFQTLDVAMASYISAPGSHDVANALRVWLCQDEPIHCDRCSLPQEKRDLCLFLGRTLDQRLFQELLSDGQRSGVFESTSSILDRYGKHRIQFLYLNVGGEIARIEAPQWVMADQEKLDLVHSLVYDQCQRSPDYPPYPPALQEAHEQAVITTAERRLVEELVERALAERGIVYARSAKDRSKRRRGV